MKKGAILSIILIFLITSCGIGENKLNAENMDEQWKRKTEFLIKQSMIPGAGYFPYELLFNRTSSLEDTYSYLELASLLGCTSRINKKSLETYLNKYSTTTDLVILLKMYGISIDGSLSNNTKDMLQVKINEQFANFDLSNTYNYENKTDILYLYMKYFELPEKKRKQAGFFIQSVLDNSDIKNYARTYSILFCADKLGLDIGVDNIVKIKNLYINDFENINILTNMNLITDIYFIKSALELLGRSVTIPEHILTVIAQQNYDGGYSLYKNEPSSSLGTLFVYKLSPHSIIDINKLIDFILTNQSQDGGFWAAKKFKPYMVSTSLSILSLKRLNVYDVRHTNEDIVLLKKMLKDYFNIDSTGNLAWHHIYYTLQCLKELGVINFTDFNDLIIKYKPSINNPKQYCYYVLSCDLVGQEQFLSDPMDKEKIIANIVATKNIDLMYYYIVIMNGFGFDKDLPNQRIKNTLKEHLDSNGFKIEGGGANLVTTYYGLKIIEMLDENKDKYLEEHWIENYKTVNGGFSIKPSDIESNSIISTFYGLDFQSFK